MAYRDHTYPFDWVLSGMQSINDLIENKFQDLIDGEFLYRDPNYPYVVKNTKYAIDFYHDFPESLGLDALCEKVREKYARRIERFFKVLGSGNKVLFIRYMKDRRHAPDELHEIQRFIGILKRYPVSFSIMLLSNENEWEPYAGDYVVNHFSVRRTTPDINESPLLTSEVQRYFRDAVRYRPRQFIKNYFFKMKKIVKQKSFFTSAS